MLSALRPKIEVCLNNPQRGRMNENDFFALRNGVLLIFAVRSLGGG